MRRLILVTAVLAALLQILRSVAVTQDTKWCGSGGWGPGGGYVQMYEPKTVETGAGGGEGGSHPRRPAVHLGPQWYREK